MKEKYIVFIIQAYQLRTDTGQLVDTVTLELIDKDYQSALERAKKLVKRKHYRLASVIENFKCLPQER